MIGVKRADEQISVDTVGSAFPVTDGEARHTGADGRGDAFPGVSNIHGGIPHVSDLLLATVVIPDITVQFR